MIVDGAKILEEIPEEAWLVGAWLPGDPGPLDINAVVDSADRTRLVHLVAGMADEAVAEHLGQMVDPVMSHRANSAEIGGTLAGAIPAGQEWEHLLRDCHRAADLITLTAPHVGGDATLDQIVDALWARITLIRKVLIAAGRLCTNCGTPTREGEPHSMGGLGHCHIPSRRPADEARAAEHGDDSPSAPRCDPPGT